MCFNCFRVHWYHRMLLPQKYPFIFPEIKKGHEIEKKSLEDLLSEKQESLEVGECQYPSIPHKKNISFLILFGFNVSVYVWSFWGLLVNLSSTFHCVLEANQWSEEWKWCFKWKIEIRRTKKKSKRKSKFGKLCVLLYQYGIFLLSCLLESFKYSAAREITQVGNPSHVWQCAF